MRIPGQFSATINSRSALPAMTQAPCSPGSPPGSSALSSLACEDGSAWSRPVPNVPQNRSCNKQSRPPRGNMIIRDGTDREKFLSTLLASGFWLHAHIARADWIKNLRHAHRPRTFCTMISVSFLMQTIRPDCRQHGYRGERLSPLPRQKREFDVRHLMLPVGELALCSISASLRTAEPVYLR